MTKDINVFCNTTTTEIPIQETGFGFSFAQACNGTERTYFEDRSGNLVDMIVQVFNNTPPPCVMTLIIENEKGERIERVVPPLTQGNAGVLILELDSVRRVLIRCEGNPAGFCIGTLFGNKFICTRCDGSIDKCELKGRK